MSLAGLEVAAHARPQRLRLADVEHARPARRGTGRRPASPGSRLQLLLDVVRHRASVSTRRLHRPLTPSTYPVARWVASSSRRSSRSCRRARLRPAGRRCSSAPPRTPSSTRTRLGARRARPRAARRPRHRARDRALEPGRAASRPRRSGDAREPRRGRAPDRHRASPSRSSTPAAGRRRSPTRRARSSRSSPPPIAAHLDRSRLFFVGNEPNLNRFWLPQFNADGSNAAAPAYLALLAADLRRAEGGLARRSRSSAARSRRAASTGPGTGRDTHSPTKFLRDLGAAYRASGRTTPIMDVLAIHPYGDQPAGAARLRAPEHDARSGSPTTPSSSRCSARRSTAPRSRARRCRSSTPSTASRPRAGGEVDALHRPGAGDDAAGREETQAAFYRQALELAFCQPNVRGIVLFHTRDEPTSTAGSRASSTPTARRSRACARWRRRSRRGAASSRAARAAAHAGRARPSGRAELTQSRQDADPLPARHGHRQRRHRPARARRGRTAGAAAARARSTAASYSFRRRPTKPRRARDVPDRGWRIDRAGEPRAAGARWRAPTLRLPRGLAWRSAHPRDGASIRPAARQNS